MTILTQFVCLTTALVLFMFLQEGWAIKCWDCRSDADPKCADPFDNTTFAITDCKQQRLDFMPDVKATMCRKIRQKFHGVWKYIRSCAYLGEPGIQGDERFCLLRTGTYNIFMEYCTCNTKDGCNSGAKLQTSLLLFSLPLFLYIILK
ncbi:uncharacterized protein crok [Tribolium castaneum]|uniref:uncharacterized protein crok n=1 Tax=Tribolium castaneum TaxID=7070 RepID=UPI0030FF0486